MEKMTLEEFLYLSGCCFIPLIVIFFHPRILGVFIMPFISLAKGLLDGVREPAITMTKLGDAKYEFSLENDGIHYSENGIPCPRAWTGDSIRSMKMTTSGEEHVFWQEMANLWYQNYEKGK